MRQAEITRNTAETQITLAVNLDAQTPVDIQTGVGFFDHMLTLFASHGRMSLVVKANGDLHVDSHHTVEDVGIALGTALREALGDKAGINRYGTSFVPMDETLGMASLDLSGRSYLVFDARGLPSRAFLSAQLQPAHFQLTTPLSCSGPWASVSKEAPAP